MKFLFVEHHPVFGGPHNQALRLDRALAARGWDTLAVLPNEPGSAAERLREGDVPVLTIPLTRVRNTTDPRTQLQAALRLGPDIARLRRVIQRSRADLVVLAGVENPHAAIAARSLGIPVVWQINGTQAPDWFCRGITPLVTRLASVVMTVGQTIAAHYPGVSAMGDRWVPFFAPVDVDVFAPDLARRDQARAELGLAPDDRVIGTVGNLNPQKGHLTFLHAAAELRRTHPSTRFVILGASHDTHVGYERALWDEAARLGLERGRDLIVQAPGSRVAQLAPAFDIFWSSSVPRSEGVPTAIGEAMALALPVVATDAGGTRDLVIDGETGFIVPTLEPVQLADATRAILDDEHLAKRLSAASRPAAIERCCIEASARDHLRAFAVAAGVSSATPASPLAASSSLRK